MPWLKKKNREERIHFFTREESEKLHSYGCSFGSLPPAPSVSLKTTVETDLNCAFWEGPTSNLPRYSCLRESRSSSNDSTNTSRPGWHINRSNSAKQENSKWEQCSASGKPHTNISFDITLQTNIYRKPALSGLRPPDISQNCLISMVWLSGGGPTLDLQKYLCSRESCSFLNNV